MYCDILIFNSLKYFLDKICKKYRVCSDKICCAVSLWLCASTVIPVYCQLKNARLNCPITYRVVMFYMSMYRSKH